jgi:hypothetical protein
MMRTPRQLGSRRRTCEAQQGTTGDSHAARNPIHQEDRPSCCAPASQLRDPRRDSLIERTAPTSAAQRIPDPIANKPAKHRRAEPDSRTQTRNGRERRIKHREIKAAHRITT